MCFVSRGPFRFEAMRPVDPGQGKATCCGVEHALVLGTNALSLGGSRFFTGFSQLGEAFWDIFG